jgi:Rhodopirellula transposase DDE domain
VPYGVYDVGANAGRVSVGITSDTAQFAVASIRRWLDAMGRERYPNARELTIKADGRWLTSQQDPARIPFTPKPLRVMNIG